MGNKGYIIAMKKSVYELDKVINASIEFNDEEESDHSKLRLKCKTKKEAFVAAKALLEKIFSIESDIDIDEVWYRDQMKKIIASGHNAKEELIRALEEGINVRKDGSEIRNAIALKIEVAQDIEDIEEGLGVLEEILEKEKLEIKKETEFVGGYAERYAE